MDSRFEQALRRVHDRHGDASLTILTALLVLLLFVLVPLIATGSTRAQIVAGLVTLTLIVGALIMSGNLTVFVVLLVALAMQVGVGIARFLGAYSSHHVYLMSIAWLMCAVAFGWVVAHAVFGPGRVTVHRVVGAIFLYLLIAVAFASLFALVGYFIPDAFSGIAFDDTPRLTGTLFYFSIVTLTSTGYGDLFPIHPIARSLCNLETILGQLYPATLLARLVSLEVAARRP
jgi:Ion channel